MENKYQNWLQGKSEEIKFWDTWLMSKGGFWKESGYDWTEDFKTRMDLNSELQAYVADEIKERDIRCPVILDVCAGPLTILNKKIPGKNCIIKCIDALANEYDLMLDRYGIVPPLKTHFGEAENYSDGLFYDVIHCSNGLDHSYDPLKAIINFTDSLNDGGFIILRHFIREGERGSYGGLHQWNFYLKDERFFISDADGKETDVQTEFDVLKAFTGAEFNFTCKSRIEGREIITVIS